MNNGSVTVGTTAVRITSNSAVLRQGLQVKAAAGNAGNVHVGKGTTVTAGTAAATDGFELSAGQGLFIPATAAHEYFAIATAASQKLYFAAI